MVAIARCVDALLNAGVIRWEAKVGRVLSGAPDFTRTRNRERGWKLGRGGAAVAHSVTESETDGSPDFANSQPMQRDTRSCDTTSRAAEENDELRLRVLRVLISYAPSRIDTVSDLASG